MFSDLVGSTALIPKICATRRERFPIISDVEGFMAYYVVYAPDDTVTAIGFFKDFSGADRLV